ncbi:DJ-1 family protein [Legionella beliardensis]|uniref:DJ-1 family protein n=1 Tax=Legionella beliardensis TaxID=91822 RepID=A0A378HYJ1_9GAMM|nr:type 1 glutamine amidotransferase domain-containing protein [Legionella beliardensis]STX27968.1 DJ-1 family protein [Legionella beliardensis]
MFIISLPEQGFDPSEAVIPWHILSQAGCRVCFATPDKQVSKADKRMVTQGLGLLSPFLMTSKIALDLYQCMIKTPEFKQPFAYEEINTEEIYGMIFPGGHGEGIKSMLESQILHKKIVECFNQNKIIGALCTGVLTVARSIDPKTQKSVLFNKKTTAVTRWMELSGWYLTRHYFHNYYRIYPTTAQDEIEKLLSNRKQFYTGGARVFPMKYSKRFLYNQFTVLDGNYVSGRWPGDCYRFAHDLVRLVKRQGVEKYETT